MPLSIPVPSTLPNVITNLKTWLPFTNRDLTDEEKNSQGATSTFYKQTLPIHYEAYNKKGKLLKSTPNITVGVSIPKKTPAITWQNLQVATRTLHNIINPENAPPEHKNNGKYHPPTNKQSTLFIQNLLSHSESGKIAMCGDNDLINWLMRDYPVLNENQLKELVAQILMAMATLHENQNIHRDIKPDNFIIYKRDNNYYLELIDIDTITPENACKFAYNWTVGYLAPEATRTEDRNGRKVHTLNTANYAKLDKKKLDCFALGKMINMILASLPCVLLLSLKNSSEIEESFLKKAKKEDRPILLRTENDMKFYIYSDPLGNGSWKWSTISESYLPTAALNALPFEYGIMSYNDQDIRNFQLNFEKLITVINFFHRKKTTSITNELLSLSYALQKKDPNTRSSIKDAMNHPCFGATPEIRQKFFTHIRKKHQFNDEYFDSWYRSAGDFYTQNDGFFTLPSTLKNIYMHAISLQTQMIFFQNLDQHERDASNSSDDYLKTTISAIRKKISELKVALKEHGEQDPHTILSTLNTAISEIENYLSATEIASYFSTMEENKDYLLTRNDKKLFDFLNNRSREQQEIDYRTSHKLMQNEHKSETSFFVLPMDKLPQHTELNFRKAYLAQNRDHALNAISAANQRRLMAINEELAAPKSAQPTWMQQVQRTFHWNQNNRAQVTPEQESMKYTPRFCRQS